MPLKTPVRNASLADQVLEILVERIRSGMYPPESQLPPENELAAEFNVSRATVRSAIGALAARGLVVRRQGIGTFVSKLSRIANPLNEAADFYGMITSQGFEHGVIFVEASMIPAGPRLADKLQIKPDELVLQTYKIFTADGEPTVYCVNHIAASLFGDTVAEEVIQEPQIIEPLYDFLEQRCNERVEYHIANIRPEIVRNLHFPTLSLPANTPVLIIEEVGYNASERPIWHSFEYYPGKKVTFELVRHRGTMR